MASLYDSASLVMIPSGVKDGKAYSIKPTDGSGDFTFSRGTDTATRVNASGLIEKERGNLLLQSNTFDTTWNLGGGTLTSGQTGYDGSSDAWLFTYTSGAAIVNQTNTFSGVQTYSVYVKGSAANGIRLYAFGSANANAYFDLNIGEVENNSGIIDAQIEDKGNGWYRCSITFDQTNTNIYMYLTGNNNSSAGSGSILIQDAQLEQGLVATDYIETTTAAVYEGITDNLPRLDYSGGASCPSLLLEPSRTNGLFDSEYFGGSSWTKNAVSVTTNNAISPEGVQNATLITADGTNTQHYILASSSQSAKTLSIFAKMGTQRYVQILTSGSADALANYDLQEGTFGNEGSATTADMEDYGNGWYRLILSSSDAATGTFYLNFVDSLLQGRFAATSSSGTIYVYGAQIEASASYPTSYMPTYGTSASRAGDSASNSTNALGGVSEGTFFIEMTRDAIDAALTGSGISLSDNSGVQEIRLHFDAPASQVRWRDGNNSFAQIGGVLSITAGTTFKILVKTDGTTAKAFGNGAQLGSDYSVVSAFDFQRIYNNGLGYRIKQQLFFPTALTDAECIALTTL